MIEDQRNSDNMIQKPELMGAMVEEQVVETFDLEHRWGDLLPLPNIEAKNSVADEEIPSLNKLDLSLIQLQCELLDLAKNISTLLVNLSNLPKDCVGGKIMQSDSVGEISNLYQVKLWLYSWEGKEHLPLYLCMQKRKLKNRIFRTKYSATERLCWEEWLKIAAEDAQDALAFQHTSDKHFICSEQKPDNIPLVNSSKPVINSDLQPADCLLDGSGNKAKRTPVAAGVLTVFEKANHWWHEPPHRQSSWSLKIKNESQRNVYHLLLLISSLLATITFHIALKTPGGLRVEEAYKYDSSPHRFSYLNNWFIAFNSTVFFLSIALLMRLFNELPLRPLLQISALSLMGAYMCIILHPLKRRSCLP